MEKTVNDFIKELQNISEKKRKLPIKIVCPNGEHTTPTIKMRIREGTWMTKEQEVEAMVITWRE
jgi:hypothetical protein